MAHHRVSEKFKKLTGTEPAKVCVAPGRVNLIGEHIDYNGFGVLPCAVGRFTYVAIGVSREPGAKALRLSSVDSGSDVFDIEFEEIARVSKESHHWSNYVVAAYLGLQESGVFLPRGIDIVVGGDLPRACGLSSSSSLVVACAMSMAHLRLSRQYIHPEQLADICMKAEWHVGTAGGGMDQAAIILSKAGFASHIEFNPLRVSPVELPKGVSFVVANSLARSAKAESAHRYFNKRVFECKLGQRILRQSIPLLGEADALKDTYAAIQSALGNPGVDKLVFECVEVIPGGAVSKSAIVSLIGQDMVEYLLTGRWGREVWDLNDEFFIQSRAIHVFTEADRVEKFKMASSRDDVDTMALCINESGRSLAEDYDCSCPELNELISAMKQSGCLAARLVGAGFGGCAVGMVSTDNVGEVISRIKDSFYSNYEGNKDEVCFAFEPVEGAFLT